LARRTLEGQDRVYYCAHPQHHSQDDLVTPEICQVCPLWREPLPAVLRPFPPPARARRWGLCLYLGEQTGLRDCPSCRGNVRVKVFGCSHPRHIETTLEECGQCADFEARAAEASARHAQHGRATQRAAK
jgi:hypothetical protein